MEHDHQTTTKRTELQMARSMCWHCQSEVTGEYYCGQCVKVQPLSKELDYFTCLGLPRLLGVDTAALEAKYYELSRSFHPDFFQGKTETEKQISLGNSALLNTAYHTLKDPIQRAEYLLKLEAGSAKDIRNSPPADLFEEILELQEDLEAFRTASAAHDADATVRYRTKLLVDREHLEERQQAMDAKLAGLFVKWDTIQTRAPQPDALRPQKDGVLKEMRELLSNRTYLRNILGDLVATLEGGHADRRH
jgi:molecular chaperone HscB